MFIAHPKKLTVQGLPTIQRPQFIWPTSLATSQRVLYGSSSPISHALYFYALQLISRFYSAHIEKELTSF